MEADNDKIGGMLVAAKNTPATRHGRRCRRCKGLIVVVVMDIVIFASEIVTKVVLAFSGPGTGYPGGTVEIECRVGCVNKLTCEREGSLWCVAV